MAQPQRPSWKIWFGLAAILASATVPRFAVLGEESFWYDEVIPMRLALTPNPSALIRLLGEIEATRAPLHPLVLQGWVRAFGRSEYAARSLSALCGVITVGVIFAIGRRLAGAGAGLWSAGLAAISPLLVVYSLEAKMYAWLTMLTCLAWWNLLAMRDSAGHWRKAAQVLLLAALAYSQPLGLFMGAALGLGSLIDLRGSRLTLRGWLAIHIVAALLVLPWIGRYFDHPPEFLSDRPTLRLLLGMPIGFTGGNSRTLLLFLVVIAVGLAPFPVPGLTGIVVSRRTGLAEPALSAGPRVRGAGPIVAWLVVPPLMLFAYSLVRDPIFGPSRYNVYVAPAYLILLGASVARMNSVAKLVVLWLMIWGCTEPSFAEGSRALLRGRKADWRAAAAFLDRRYPGAPLWVVAPAPGRNLEIEVARYYLGNRRAVESMPEDRTGRMAPIDAARSGNVFISASLKDGSPVGDISAVEGVDRRAIEHWDFPGLRLIQIRPRKLP